MLYNFFAPRTLSKIVCVHREGYYLSECLFKIGKNYLLPPLPIGEKNDKKGNFVTSNAYKMTVNQLFQNLILYLDF
jgi:hypothetical protein